MKLRLNLLEIILLYNNLTNHEKYKFCISIYSINTRK